MDFRDYQRLFTAHIRDPREAPRPPGAPVRRMRVYNELLFNNVEGFLLACFPVCRSILGKRRWTRLARAFFRDHASHSPYFRQIPEEFLRYLRDEYAWPEDLPDFLPELAHYEWVELALETSALEPDTADLVAAGEDPVEGVPLLNPVLMVLAYRYPVQRISSRYKPRLPPAQPTFILAYREVDTLEVRFQVINAASARLLALLQESPALTGSQAIAQVSAEMGADPRGWADAGRALLTQWRTAGVLLGFRGSPT